MPSPSSSPRKRAKPLKIERIRRKHRWGTRLEPLREWTIVSRKKKHPPHENHERWLVSYADFMTLLFAFFVVMFASSQTDKAKAQQFSEALSRALEGQKVASILTVMLGGTLEDKGKGNAMLRGPGGANK